MEDLANTFYFRIQLGDYLCSRSFIQTFGPALALCLKASLIVFIFWTWYEIIKCFT